MKVVNRKAYYEYHILETFEAGIRLSGAEVKSIRESRVQLTGSFVRIMGSEAYLVNAVVPVYPYARVEGYDERRRRKLLLHKKELIALKIKLDEGGGLALVPVSIYEKKGLIKLEVGLGRGKRAYDKRASIKKRDLDREKKALWRGKV